MHIIIGSIQNINGWKEGHWLLCWSAIFHCVEKPLKSMFIQITLDIQAAWKDKPTTTCSRTLQNTSVFKHQSLSSWHMEKEQFIDYSATHQQRAFYRLFIFLACVLLLCCLKWENLKESGAESDKTSPTSFLGLLFSSSILVLCDFWSNKPSISVSAPFFLASEDENSLNSLIRV